MSDNEQGTAAPSSEAVESNLESQESVESQEAGQEESASVEAAVEAAQKAEEKRQANIKKLKLKVDGEEIEEELNLDDEATLVKHLQMSKAAQKRMQEAAEQRKQIEALLSVMQSTPEKALAELGIDPEEFAYNLLQKRVEDAKKSPEQLEKERMAAELEQLKSKIKQEEDDRKKAEFERLQAEAEKKIEDGMTRALETAGIPKSPLAVKKMAELMYLALENNIDLDPSDVVPIVRKELEDDVRALISAAPDELVEALIGKDRLSNIRKKQVNAIKKNKVITANSVKPTGKEGESKEEKKRVKMSDFFKGV